MNRRPFLPLVAVFLLAYGCGAPSTGVANPDKPKSYASIVSLSPSTSEYLADLGGGMYLVGRDTGSDRPEEMQNVEIVTKNLKPDYARITELKPDLIIYDATLYNDDDVAKLEQLGFETLALDAHNVDQYRDFGEKLAARVTIEMTMSRYLDKVYQALAVAAGKKTTQPRTTLMLGDGKESNYLVMGTKGLHADVFSKCGAKPVGVDSDVFQAPNLESLIDMDPEIIYSDGNAQAIYSDARLQGVSAVKNRHVYDIDGKDILRIGAKLNTIIERISKDVFEMPVNPPTGAKK